jgi:hypothetical protein
LAALVCVVVAYVNRERELEAEGWTEYAPVEEDGELAAPLVAEEIGSVFDYDPLQAPLAAASAA